MTGVRALDRLHAERNIWLATVRPDGCPHVAPVWFVYVDERIWVGTGLDSVRVRNLRSNPAASATLEDGDSPVVAEGTVDQLEQSRNDDVYRFFHRVADVPQIGRAAPGAPS